MKLRALSFSGRRHGQTTFSGRRHGGLLAAAMILSCIGCSPGAPQETKLLLYCGAGLRPPVDQIAREFAKQYGIRIECDYAGSEVLLSRIKLSGRGELYMPGDVYYVDMAEDQGLIASQRDVCYFVPVIMVQKGNPKNIRTLADLSRPGIKIGLGDPKACSIGRKCSEIFAKNDISEEDIDKNVKYRSLTVNELGNHIKVGALDAVIVWDAVAACFPDEGEVVPIPAEQNVISTVAVGTLKSSSHPEQTARFVEFITSARGKEILAKYHYATALPE